MGHASNLVGNQKADVSFHFHTLPLFAGVRAVAEKTTFRLLEGYSAETSGNPCGHQAIGRGNVRAVPRIIGLGRGRTDSQQWT